MIDKEKLYLADILYFKIIWLMSIYPISPLVSQSVCILNFKGKICFSLSLFKIEGPSYGPPVFVKNFESPLCIIMYYDRLLCTLFCYIWFAILIFTNLWILSSLLVAKLLYNLKFLSIYLSVRLSVSHKVRNVIFLAPIKNRRLKFKGIKYVNIIHIFTKFH